MTKEELSKIIVLYKSLNTLDRQIKKMNNGTNPVFDVVRGGVANNTGGRGQTIIIKGHGDENLGKKTQQYRIEFYCSLLLISKAEIWIGSLPEGTAKQKEIKDILTDRYLNEVSLETIAKERNSDRSTIGKKINKFINDQLSPNSRK